MQRGAFYLFVLSVVVQLVLVGSADAVPSFAGYGVLRVPRELAGAHTGGAALQARWVCAEFDGG